ncbi:MAG: dihydrofolate reductase family protein, partial [Acidimicrobiia bacterium]
AVSLDGYVAGEDGTVSFLDDYGTPEYGFEAFFDSIGALVMGSSTYEQILGWGWPYGETPGLVLTTRNLDAIENVDITFSSEPTGDAIRAYADSTDKRLWVVGGGRVICDAMNAGAVDLLELYVMPEVLGAGIPLFPEPFTGRLSLVESAPFENGVVKLLYSVEPAS